MRGTSAGRRLFGFAKAALCTLADEKTTEKVEIQPGLSVPCEQGKNIEL